MLVICGDSFNVGIGLKNMERDRYGQLVANHFKIDCVTLARGSSSNYGVYLQGKYTTGMKPKPSLVILSVTSYDRVDWIEEFSKPKEQLTLENLNYDGYPPHNFPPIGYDTPLDFFVKDKNYKPIIYTDQAGTLYDYLYENVTYYPRFLKEPRKKLELIYQHYLQVFCVNNDVSPIKKDYDVSLILNAYTQIKRADINCLVLTDDIQRFSSVIDTKDIINHNWFRLANKYPDTLNTAHADEYAHTITADQVIKRIKENNYL